MFYSLLKLVNAILESMLYKSTNKHQLRFKLSGFTVREST